MARVPDLELSTITIEGGDAGVEVRCGQHAGQHLAQAGAQQGVEIHPADAEQAGETGVAIAGRQNLRIASARPQRGEGVGPDGTRVVDQPLVVQHIERRAQPDLLLLLGAASYSIYLIHQLALQFVLRLIETFVTRPDPVSLIAIGVITFVAAALAGVAMHLWIEKPVTGWLHGLAKRGRGKRAAKPAPDAVPTGAGPA
mgnify:CR=1 FL=1